MEYKFNFFKLAITFVVIAIPVLGFFTWQALGSAFLNVTLKTNPDLEAGLVGHWTFDGKNMSTNVADVSGQGNNGYLTGQAATTTARGKVGQALEFDGDDDVVDVAGYTGISGSNARSVTGWFKTVSSASGQGLVSWGSDNGLLTAQGFNLTIESGGVFAGRFFNGVTLTACGSGFNDNEWHHFVYSYPQGGQNQDAQIYIDATVQSCTAGAGTTVLNTATTLTVNIGLDQRQSGGGFNNFNGSLEDIRIYNRALSAEEVKRLYELGATTHINVSLKTNPDLEAGLVGHWTFDGKNMSTNVADVSGQGNNGYLTGQAATSTARGRVGQALEFDGSDDYIDTNVDDPYDLTASLTISAWVYHRSSGGTQHITSKNPNSGGAPATPWQFAVLNTNVLRSYNSNGVSTNTIDSTDTINSNEWQHVVLVRDDAGATVTFYINGVRDSAGLQSYTTANVGASTVTAKIGAVGGVNTDVYWTGLLDDVRIYNRALSAEEVKRLYELGATTHINVSLKTNPNLEAGLVGHWTFDGKNMSTNVADVSGQGNNGYLTGQAATTTARGRVGQALQFDGSDDYVRIGDVLEFERTDPFSMSAWVKTNYTSTASNQQIVGKADGGAPFSGYQLLVRGDAAGDPYEVDITNSFSPSNVIQVRFPRTANTEWQHVVFAYSGSSAASGVQGYVNGEAQTMTISIDTLSSSILNNIDLQIGAQDGTGNPFDGLLDDVRIYNRALSAEEVKRLYELTR